MADSKACTKCNKVKTLVEFDIHQQAKDGKSSWCKFCSRKVSRDYRARMKASDPEAWREKQWATEIRRNYSLTSEQYYYILECQGGVCAICSCLPSSERNHGKSKLSVDHDHSCCPGKSCGKCVRGLLCNYCNNGIARFSDNSDLMRSAVVYIDSWSDGYQSDEDDSFEQFKGRE